MCKPLCLPEIGSLVMIMNMGSATEKRSYEHANPFRNMGKHWYYFLRHADDVGKTIRLWKMNSWLCCVQDIWDTSQLARFFHFCFTNRLFHFHCSFRPSVCVSVCLWVCLLLLLLFLHPRLCLYLSLSPLIAVLLSAPSQKCSRYWCTPMHSLWQEQTAWKEKLLK